MSCQMRLFGLIFLLTTSVLAQSQQTESVHWYNLISIVPLDAVGVKQATTLIEAQGNIRTVSYTFKSRVFNVSSSGELNLGDLLTQCNEQGYYLADVTQPGIHHGSHTRAGKAFQLALLFARDLPVFQLLELVLLPLNEAERMLLQVHHHIDTENWESNELPIGEE